MTKLQFLQALGQKLSPLPKIDLEGRLRFYTEMIEDRMEEGFSEEEAVAAVGSVEEIAAQILVDFPQPEPKKKNGWLIALLILGSPVWFSLLMAAFAVALSLYVSLWSVIVSLWAVFGSLALCGLVGLAAGIISFVAGRGLIGVASLSAGLVCGGLSIFLFFGIKALTLVTIGLTKKLALRCFAKKEAA